MSEKNKIHIFFICFCPVFIIYSSFNLIGPWDEYHLLYFFKNAFYFPLYDNNFTYYDSYLLGRFSPLTGQEFNIPILLSLDLKYSFIFVAIIIITTLYFYYYILIREFEFFTFKIFFLFFLILLSSPGFYLLTTRLLYAEDTLALLLIIFLFSFLKSIFANNFNIKKIIYLLFFFTTAVLLLYKENSFIIISSFILSFYYFDYKNKNKYRVIIFLTLLFNLIYLGILGYINLIYKDQNLSYLQNSDFNFLLKSFFTFIRYAFFNDPIIFFFFLPLGFYGLFISKNVFYKSIYISGLCNIIFYISLGMFSPYYIYLCYFLMFPIFVEVCYKLFLINNLKLILFKFSFVLFISISFINSIFYYFESKSLSLSFNNTLDYVSNEIENSEIEKTLKIFICNKLDEGNLAKVYIFGEHLKYRGINFDKFQFFSLHNNPRNQLNSRISPFDNNFKNNYLDSIFVNKNKLAKPKKGDIILSMPSYSNDIQNNCSFLNNDQYSEQIFYTSSFYNTLISNLVKVLVYKKGFNKRNFIRTFEYKIFKL